MEKPRMCYVVSSEMTVAAFLQGHIRAAAERYDLSVVVNTTNENFLRDLGLPGRLVPMPIHRTVLPFTDLRALWLLYRFLRRQRIAIVHSVTPKAGLLAMLAARLARVPHRIHTFTGQVWVTREGWRRFLLKFADKFLAALTTRVLVDSPSQREFMVASGILPEMKAEVIGKGSICGVDTDRFRPDANARTALRLELGLVDDDQVLLFLGRLNRDKGIVDLTHAFVAISALFPRLHLLLVGPDEGVMLPGVITLCATAANRVHYVGRTLEPSRYMAAADIFCLPSYREGFGMVAAEAAAVGLPVVASRIYGVTDAVEDGFTGLLHKAGDASELEQALMRLLNNPEEGRAMGVQGREKVLRDFSSHTVTTGLMKFYAKILS